MWGRPMIISVRGTSGSGKTHLARELMALYPSREDVLLGEKLVGHDLGGSLFVLGPYRDSAWSGGADMMGKPNKDREAKFRLIYDWALRRHVFYEGLMEGNEVQRTVALSRQFETHVIFLDTPLDLCLQAVNERRAARGITEPVDPRKTEEKHAELTRVRVRLRQAGVTTHMLGREAALNCVRGLLGV